MKNTLKKQNGITLIALIITVIVLLILAGITINLTMGQDGIITRAQEAKNAMGLAQVQEQIQLTILEVELEKEKGTTEEVLNLLLQKLMSQYEGINVEIEGNMLVGIYNDYAFVIDKDLNLTLDEEKTTNLSSMKVEVQKEIIEYLGKNDNDKYALKQKITLQSDGVMKSIEIENTDGTTTIENIAGTNYTKEIEVELDRVYKITILDEQGQKVIKRIKEYSTEEISSVAEFVELRDNVNKGLTYEGKTIDLTQDLDLSSVCYKVDGTTENDISWKPIGNELEKTSFKANFNGNNHTISNLYINKIGDAWALFGVVINATIKDLNVKGNIIFNGSYAAGLIHTCRDVNIVNCRNYVNITQTGSERASITGIVGWISNGLIKNCKNYGTMDAYGGYASGIVNNMEKTIIEKCINYANISSKGGFLVGGIAAHCNSGTIKECVNYANLKGTTSGGILGGQFSGAETVILNCYNAGVIEAKITGGICGDVYSGGKTDIQNSYNYGVLTGGATAIDGICTGEGSITVNNVYSLDTAYSTSIGQTITASELQNLASTLGESMLISDSKDKNNNWLYNNGYPILKWQLSTNSYRNINNN